MNKLTRNKTNKHTHTQTHTKKKKKKKNSRFRKNRISVLVILVLLLQNPLLVLVFKQRICLSLTKWLGSLANFFSVLQLQLLSLLLPQWGVACSQVPKISSVAYQLSCWSADCLLSRIGAGVWWCRSPPVSQCNMARRSFVWARGSGCPSFDSSWYFISTKCGSSLSARFLIYGAHVFCFCILVVILDPS
jgi:hypothetical protein